MYEVSRPSVLTLDCYCLAINARVLLCVLGCCMCEVSRPCDLTLDCYCLAINACVLLCGCGPTCWHAIVAS
jgi:hypothetical protein